MEAPKPHGSFVWYDLMSPDEDTSKEFYSSVVGWTTEPFQPVPEMPVYTMWKVGDSMIGGIAPPSPESQNIPPHWLLYIGADDVDKTVEDIKSNGGQVLHGPEDIPTVGRFAMCSDPQGAVFAVFTSAESAMGSGAPPSPGFMSWHELASTDAKAGLEFYRTVFGWNDTETMDMGEEMGDYDMFDAGDWPIGGAYTIPASMAGMPPSWMPYIMTNDLDGACGRVSSMGGHIMNGPMEVPGGGRVAMCTDAHGAAFGLHEAGPEMAEDAAERSMEATA